MLYHHNRTHVLVLDFDTKHHSQQIVDADFARALSWISDAGGVAVTDQSTSGGRHIIVPLAIGTTATLAEIIRAHAAAGSPATQPGQNTHGQPQDRLHHRARFALPRRRTPHPQRAAGRRYRRLHHPLASGPAPPAQRSPRRTQPTPATAPTPSATDAITQTGPDARLRPEYTRTTDLPERITAYANTGQLPDDATWRSHSEARQSVLAHAALHGHSLATIQALMAPGRPWHTGLAGAYTRYRHNADRALQRDWHKALNWAATNSPLFRPACAQEQEHTGGTTRGPELHRSWLANAIAWLDREYPLHPYKWIGAAIYQALAIQAVRGGEVINGVPVVGVGGRSLSIAAGLLSETTVWEFLRHTRDQRGAPLIRTRIAQGREPDYYALTTQQSVETSSRAVQRTRVENVHIAWKIIGHRHRRIYELIVDHELTKPEEIFAAAHTSTSTGYTILAALATAGLISRRRGHVSAGPVTLDQIAAAHHLDEQRTARIQRHQQQRAKWHNWLAMREEARTAASEYRVNTPPVVTEPPEHYRDEYLTAVLATGPPTIDEEQQALELLAELVGGRILATVG